MFAIISLTAPYSLRITDNFKMIFSKKVAFFGKPPVWLKQTEPMMMISSNQVLKSSMWWHQGLVSKFISKLDVLS